MTGNSGGTHMQNNLWIITSTINTNLGLIPPKLRFEQTLETFDSIKCHDPSATILFVDNSSWELTATEINTIKNLSDFCYHVGNRRICRVFNSQGIKGAGEAYMVLLALEAAKELTQQPSRIIKICGRYRLQPSFDIKAYLSQQSKFCFKTLEHNNWGRPFLHTRLWSACASLIQETESLVRNSLRHMLSNNITLEEAFAANIDLTRLTELNKIHCEGFIAPWNKLIED